MKRRLPFYWNLTHRNSRTNRSAVEKKTKLRAQVSTPGPKPDKLKLKGNWRDAVKRSLQKKKPPQGWPK
jgi:hypothetical protein